MVGFEQSGGQPLKEIKRKFLLPSVPRYLREYEGENIRQGYLVIGGDGSEARLRDREGNFSLTVKSNGDLVRDKSKIDLNSTQFNTLWPATVGKRLDKVRFSIPYLHSLVELDLYSGSLKGLIIAKVEFPDVASAEAFSTPDWFGSEVTADKAFKTQQLATQGCPLLPSTTQSASKHPTFRLPMVFDS